jgi:hypothetical protein
MSSDNHFYLRFNPKYEQLFQDTLGDTHPPEDDGPLPKHKGDATCAGFQEMTDHPFYVNVLSSPDMVVASPDNPGKITPWKEVEVDDADHLWAEHLYELIQEYPKQAICIARYSSDGCEHGKGMVVCVDGGQYERETNWNGDITVKLDDSGRIDVEDFTLAREFLVKLNKAQAWLAEA